LLQGESSKEDFTVFASAEYGDLPDDYFDHPEEPYEPGSDEPFHSRVGKATGPKNQRTVMARTHDWKLILNESRPPELYHMAGGYVEKQNLADQKTYTDIKRTLEKQIHSEWKR
jgi:hypothetical protein